MIESEILNLIKNRFCVVPESQNVEPVDFSEEDLPLILEAVKHSCLQVLNSKNNPEHNARIENYARGIALREFSPQSDLENAVEMQQLDQYKSWLNESADRVEQFVLSLENFLSEKLSFLPKSTTIPTWNYLPLPDEPDKHAEFHSARIETSDGSVLVAARARGKKHKHEGTNCDDWFEISNVGSWSLIAVADGAGSKKFSRVGAKASCQQAIDSLRESLENHIIQTRSSWTAETFSRDTETKQFIESDLRHVEQSIHEAIRMAYQAVEAATLERVNGELIEEYRKLLGRELTVNDLSATLLIAVHTNIEVNDSQFSLIFACQIGDGISCVVDHTGQLRLLCVPDSGEFSGETDFLTSKKFEREGYLASRTYPFFGKIKSLMVMTDGVADDYFPSDPELLRLYDDLQKNGVVSQGPTLYKMNDSTIEELPENGKPTEADIEESTVNQMVEATQAVVNDEVKSDRDKTTVEQYETTDSAPEERLLQWIDSYNVRGSFDDRTLVVLFREGE